MCIKRDLKCDIELNNNEQKITIFSYSLLGRKVQFRTEKMASPVMEHKPVDGIE